MDENRCAEKSLQFLNANIAKIHLIHFLQHIKSSSCFRAHGNLKRMTQKIEFFNNLGKIKHCNLHQNYTEWIVKDVFAHVKVKFTNRMWMQLL
jgi:hypothetical protein